MANAQKSSKRRGHGESILSAPELVRLLGSIPHPVRHDELLRINRLPGSAKKQLEALCSELEKAGRIVRAPSGGWTTVDKLTSVTGRLSVPRMDSGSGGGFVTPELRDTVARLPLRKALSKKECSKAGKNGQGKFYGDVFIHPAYMGDAWHGDRVRVLLVPGRRGKSPEGRIVEVLERGQRELAVKVLHETGGKFLCRAADSRMNAMFEVDASALVKKPARDALLLVTPSERLTPGLWAAVACRDFGLEEDVAVQEQLVKLNHQIPQDFPQRVLQEAAAFSGELSPEDKVGREDLTALSFVTIDGETARDFDDAVFVQKTEQGFRLAVAVADVTYYVTPGSALDKEAQERANSWYFPVSVEPMLPPALSNGLCSLHPGVERLAVVVGIDFDCKGRAGTSRFYAARIRSAARLTYGQVQDFLDGKGRMRQECSVSVQTSLQAAAELAALLHFGRKERGSLDFELSEPAYSFDELGRIAAITHRERLFSHRIIEECMIAANEAVARFLEERALPVLYRVHPLPEPERLTALFRSLRTVEWARPIPLRPSAGDLSVFLQAARGTPQEFLIGRLCLRAMMQARYQPENEGHFGLASRVYCHATSPIRRYADIVVHRALKYALGLFPGPLFSGGRLLALADYLSRRERAAMESEREMARRLAVLLLADRVGEHFDGVISSVNDFGFFVELADMPVEGLVRCMELADYYEYDMDRQRLLGRNTGRQFKLGQPVRVVLADVHKGRLEIHLLPEEQAGSPSAPIRRRSGGASSGRRQPGGRSVHVPRKGRKRRLASF